MTQGNNSSRSTQRNAGAAGNDPRQAVNRGAWWRWVACLPVAAIWLLAMTRLFLDPLPRLPLVFNWTPSLPYHVAWMHFNPPALERGDLIVYAFDGEETERHPGLRGQPFFKRIRGIPGDVIEVDGRSVRVNGEAMGYAKWHTFDHQPLSPLSAGVIPPGHYYVQGTSPDSFDSRYRSSGLVPAKNIIATLSPLF